MLRSVSSKLGGLLLVVLFLFLLWLPRSKEASRFCVVRQVVFWLLRGLFYSLSVLGACHPETPFVGVRLFLSLRVVFFMAIFKAGWVHSFVYPRVVWALERDGEA